MKSMQKKIKSNVMTWLVIIHRLSTAYMIRNVRLTLSSLQLGSLGKQCSQSSCVAPSMTSREPGNNGNLMKLGGPFFLRNSKTLTAPKETEATGGFLPSWGWVSECQPHMSWPCLYKLQKHELKSCRVIPISLWSKSKSSGAQLRFFFSSRPELT